MQIRENVDLAGLNSFLSGESARYFAECESVEDIKSAIQFAKEKNLQTLILGEGTNTLFLASFAGLVVKMNIKGVRFEPQSTIVGAGENWDSLVSVSLKNGLYGLENLSWIPGSVGAAPVQNIGAYGVEIKDCIKEVKCLDVATFEIIILSKSECRFAYRDSIFKHNKNLIILEVTFALDTTFTIKNAYSELQKIQCDTALELREKIIEIRKNKMPDHLTVRNAGSFFKNPIVDDVQLKNLLEEYPDLIHFAFEDMHKLAAAYLIEKFFHKRGYMSEIGVGLWPQQALVLYAENKATSSDVYRLSEQIIDTLHKVTGITLEREVNIIK